MALLIPVFSRVICVSKTLTYFYNIVSRRYSQYLPFHAGSKLKLSSGSCHRCISPKWPQISGPCSQCNGKQHVQKVQTTNCSFKVVSESKYEDTSQKILGHCLYAPETWARETPRWLSDLSMLDLSHLWYFWYLPLWYPVVKPKV